MDAKGMAFTRRFNALVRSVTRLRAMPSVNVRQVAKVLPNVLRAFFQTNELPNVSLALLSVDRQTAVNRISRLDILRYHWSQLGAESNH